MKCQTCGKPIEHQSKTNRKKHCTYCSNHINSRKRNKPVRKDSKSLQPKDESNWSRCPRCRRRHFLAGYNGHDWIFCHSCRAALRTGGENFFDSDMIQTKGKYQRTGRMELLNYTLTKQRDQGCFSEKKLAKKEVIATHIGMGDSTYNGYIGVMEYVPQNAKNIKITYEV